MRLSVFDFEIAIRQSSITWIVSIVLAHGLRVGLYLQDGNPDTINLKSRMGLNNLYIHIYSVL